jgi:hypothetical protein
MAGIEMLLVSKVLKMESNREPLSVSEGLELANSLIRYTVHQSDLVKWKQDNLGRSQSIRDPEDAGRLGQNYWSGFRRRHPMLREKKHVKFDQKKDDFVKRELFQGMYTQIYTKQVRTSISVIHPEERCYD